MVLLTFRKEVGEDVRVLLSAPVEAFMELCRVAVSNVLTSSSTSSNYTKVAQKLGIEVEAFEKAMEALTFVFLESTKRGASEADVQRAADELALPTESSHALVAVYGAHHKQLAALLTQLSMELPSYHNVDWRLDVEVASRSMRYQALPSFVLDLQLREPAPVTRHATTTTNSNASANGDAADASVPPANGVTHSHYIQSDFATLQHVGEVLERAVQESNSKHVRRYIRYVK